MRHYPSRPPENRAAHVLVGLIAFVAILAWTGVWFSVPGRPTDTEFVIAPGDSIETITDGLVDAGVVRSRAVFKAALRASGLATRLQPGTYNLSGIDSYAVLIERLATGGVSADEFVLRVLEGWNLRDIEAALAQAGYGRAAEIFQVTGLPATDHRTLSAAGAPQPDDFSARFPYLTDKPSYVSLEGFLFPDTYRVFRDATPEEIALLMLGNFDLKLTPEMRAKIAAQGRSIYDVVTMASIVEREVRGDEDRRQVADLFWRRLDVGMALQADSTVNYITGGSKPSVTYEETRNVSPWNTYKYPGLPLGPIGNPGLSALQATIEPEPNLYWYFLTDKEGNVHYGRTLDEHNRNKAKYLR